MVFLLVAACTSIENAEVPSHATVAPDVPREADPSFGVETASGDRSEVAAPEPDRPVEQPGLPSADAIAASILHLLGPNRTPLKEDGHPIFRVQIERPESPLVYAVSVDSASESNLEELQKLSRLYDRAAERIQLRVHAFDIAEGCLSMGASADVGTAKALGDFRLLPLGESKDSPIVASVEVLTEGGREVRWIVFASSASGSARFDLVQTTAISTEAVDIDGDGTLDVYQRRRVAEPGVGVETYLTLYQWNGREFAQTAGVTAVRGVNAFLSRSLDYIADSRWDGLLSFAVDPLTRAAPRFEGTDTRDMVRHLLRVEHIADAEAGRTDRLYPFLEEESEIVDVFGPPVLEYPFGADGEFRYDFRLLCCEGEGMIVSLRVKLTANPFDTPVFVLVPWE